MELIRLAPEVKSILGESPVWDGTRQTLYWVDIKGRNIHRLRFGGGPVESLETPEEIGCVALACDGGLVGALKPGFARIGWEAGSFEYIANPEKDIPGNRFNDGKCDRFGRFWAGTMDAAEKEPAGSLYCLFPDGAVKKALGGYVTSNGVGWSPGGSVMYFTDSANRAILAFDFDGPAAILSNKRVFATIPKDAGYPDGLTVDAQGYVWSAHWDGARITRYRPDGAVDRVIPMPVRRPTSLVFGGPALDRLYVTSAATPGGGMDSSSLEGALFEMRPGVAGLPGDLFGG
jgi:sugar lactone lactonase YvrE